MATVTNITFKKTSDGSAKTSALEQAVDFVKKGSKLIKVRSKFSKNVRYFVVDREELFLTYRGSKKKKQCTINLTEIQEIRSGSDSDAFTIAYGRKRNFPPESQCFSLVIGKDKDMLDLVALSDEERELWINGITECCQRLKAKSADPMETLQLWAREQFKEADKDKNGQLSLKEITRLLNIMNLEMDEGEIVTMMGKTTLDSDGFLKFFMKILEKQELIKSIFKKYVKGHMYWTNHELHQFLTQDEKEEVTQEQCEKLIEQNEICPNLKKNHRLSLAGFNTFLNSDLMNIKAPKCQQVYQDMNQPLSHYFINSSHNTYLESDQLQGYSRTECYIKALKSGCRCVEVDVWDGDNGEPMVKHGFTLTSKILFSDVIKVINKYAFSKSKYPLILSIENHCNVDQQNVMARQMKSVFGDKLFMEELLPESNYHPPPSQLMEKIVIKCKKIPGSKRDERRSIDDEDGDDDRDVAAEIDVEFSECINICQNASFKSFQDSRDNQTFQNILSFSEARALKLAKQVPQEFVQHNKRQLSRIFPAGTRVGSTNYDPVPLWTVGCQIVALNYQTSDDGMQLNRGLFEDNGGCGYVLKPDFMRNFSHKATFSPDGIMPNTWSRTLHLKILGAFCLPKKEGDSSKSILDPYVQVSVWGIPLDRKTFRTDTIFNNGFNPVWNTEFKFFISCPQLALLHFQVFDYENRHSDVVIAQYCLPVRCLQKGYRTVHLKTVSGEPLEKAKLYVHVSLV